jgi:hypothetical protein
VLAVLTGEDAEDDEAPNFEPFQLMLDDNAFAPVEACGGEFINSLNSTSTTYEDIVRQHIVSIAFFVLVLFSILTFSQYCFHYFYLVMKSYHER